MSRLLPALLAAALGGFAIGALAALLLTPWRATARRVTYSLAALGSLATAGAGLVAVAGASWQLRVPWLLLPPGLELGLDPLSGFFLTVIGVVATPVSLYAIGYTRSPDPDPAAGATGQAVAYHAFVAAMTLVPLAANVLTFLVVWELMALASYVLVMAHPDERGVTRAGWVYALVTHAGLACLLAGMLLLAHATGSDRFADWGGAAAGLPGGLRTTAFLLLALGFGSKAGLVPVHVWLPLAHPAAPSHVSALMSGLMIKLGVYGLLRIGFEWLGGGPVWWGVLLLLIAALSALLGVLYALVEHDLKRLLAYHSVENVGIILLGVGAGVIFRALGLDTLARLSVVAALYHTLNHAVFKALLFLGAGAVLKATGTRNMELMGGLVRRMPWTAGSFLVGAAAISALPPLNGFVSEWLTFQVLLESVRLPRQELALVFVLGLAALALTGGLAAACFVKAFGIGFLALPRSEAAAGAAEVSVTLRVGMVTLAALSVALGLGATLVVPWLDRAGLALFGRLAARAPLPVASGLVLAIDEAAAGGTAFASLSPAVVAVLLGVALAGLPLGLRLLGARRDRRPYETWGCGRSLQTARMEYTATAFSQPFKRIFAVLYRPVKQLDIEFHPESRFFVRTIHFQNPTRSLIEEWLYLPVLGGARRAAGLARRIQSGHASLYLAYIFAVLLLLLLVAR